MTGVRAELVFENASDCPVATLSETTDGPLTDVSWTMNGDSSIKEQFTGADCDLEFSNEESMTEVFDYGSQQVYEFEQELGRTCICEHIEQELGPVTDAFAADGNLHVTLHTANVDILRTLLSDLKERFGQVRVEYLVQGRANRDDEELIPVDMSQLTDRQREVLQQAYEMGYFEYPRTANASEVAEELGIRPSTFTEHLNTAQSKLLDDLLLRS